ncbi:pyridoxal 5'-phosphate synthase glutaminase subunit PdxT [Nakamurella leprariae]|uniref:Pyridoxal 5'-phosphate synthase subunit PdxT n=1 Tax=Nakamurella leprariae TaxID=2803911 RepID=A0A938YF69_9ACTN|nr:pyridoxal 5'-phosphate synthase glutaminase subunit PdxT [Nakamurella leprariae]MBM9467039.1 pyridoxal 5'-phosphate synthase glutaminase subunit PdxT [Nakamurella leprariae]
MTGGPDPVVGVLALQGDVAEHLSALAELGVLARPVRRPADLQDLDGIVLPGGESTTICRLLDVFGLRAPLRDRLTAGLPAFGSCAGMIVLAREILDGRPDQRPLGVLDAVVRRNAFGRQVDSFETDLAVAGLEGPVRAVFIRAPWIEQAGPDVQVLASVAGHPVAVRQGSVLATSFHPEIAGDLRLHRMFLDVIADSTRPLGR